MRRRTIAAASPALTASSTRWSPEASSSTPPTSPSCAPSTTRRSATSTPSSAFSLVALEAKGLLDESLVVFVSDHGEELLDHDSALHGYTLYEEQLRIPLMIRHPELPARRVSRLSRQVDVLPTVLELLGFPIPEPLQGESLAAAMKGEQGPDVGDGAPVFAEASLRAIRTVALDSYTRGDWKLIETRVPEARRQLFNLRDDPQERHDRLASEPEVAERLSAELQRFRDALPVGRSEAVALKRVPLGRPPFLHRLRRRFPSFVRQLPRYYGAIRLPTTVHHRIASLDFPVRPAAPLAAGGRGISRFPCEVLPCVLGVSDRAGPSRISRKRCDRCGLPPVSTTSAPRSCPKFSRLDTRPARTPVNASPPTSRSTAHDSGPVWVATPSPYDSSIRYTSPVLTGARTPPWTPESVWGHLVLGRSLYERTLPEIRCGSDWRKGEVTVAAGDVPLFETDLSAR